jgi:hypothetical protein
MMIPSFEWGSSDSFECSLPAREWSYGIEQDAGHAVSAAGLPASYVVRDQETVTMTLRVLESEWAGCLEFLRAGMRGEPIDWTPSEDEAALEVFFSSPVAGEEFEVDRDPEYPRVLNVTITLRASDGGDIGVIYYGEES